MRRVSKAATTLGWALFVTTWLVPLGSLGQVKDVFRDKVPPLEEKVPPSTKKPSTPERVVPGPPSADPRKAKPVPERRAPVPGRTKIVPGGAAPLEEGRLPKNDLGVRLLAARVVPSGRARTEVEVELANNGPDAFSSEASVRVNVFPADDGLCRWPQEFLRDIPHLRSGERRVIVVSAAQTDPACGAPNSRRPDRSAARATATVEWYGRQFLDLNRSNNNHSTRLVELMPAERTSPALPVEVRVRFIQPTYVGLGTVELDWLSVELNGDVDRADHPQLRVLGQRDRNTKSHLSVRGGESVLVGSRAFLVKAQARAGDQLVLRIRARDRDCAGNRDCRRGDTGEFRTIFHVPSFSSGQPPGCDEQTWQLRDLPGFRFELGSGPQFSIGEHEDVVRVCFEASGL